MANFNQVILIGRLTRDPELRYTPAGIPVCNVGLAVNKEWTEDSGQKKESTLFIDVTVWRKPAETFSKHLKKGSQVFVEGELRQESWEDDTTSEKHYKHVVTVNRFQFVDNRPKEENEHSRPAKQNSAPSRERSVSS